jgi:hypothetical protein
VMDDYAYANPLLEPMSLDALAVPDPDDIDVMTHPLADLECEFEQAWMQTKIDAFLRALSRRDRDLLWRVYWQGETQTSVARRSQVRGAAISKRMSCIQAQGRIALATLWNGMLLQ